MNEVVRVVIVDDDIWVRAGRAAVLAGADGVEVIAATDHDGAHDWPWSDVDVLLVDAHDSDAGFDQFVGVGVAAVARRASSETRIVVLSGHSDNDLLRIRMAEAGADEFHAHRDIDSADALVGLVTHGRGAAASSAAAADAELVAARLRLGISPSARVNEAVSWADEHLDAGVFEAETQTASGTSRRRFITARRRLSSMVGLDVRASSAARRSLPAWREVADFVDRARGRERRG